MVLIYSIPQHEVNRELSAGPSCRHGPRAVRGPYSAEQTEKERASCTFQAQATWESYKAHRCSLSEINEEVQTY